MVTSIFVIDNSYNMSEKIIKDLIQIRKTLQNKFLDLKRGSVDEISKRDKDLLPITQPLKTIIDINRKNAKIIEKLEDEDADGETDSIPEYEDSESKDEIKESYRSTEGTHSLAENTNEYIQVLYNRIPSVVDKTYGLNILPNNQIMMGNKVVKIEKKDITIGSTRYKGTRGLYELLISNKPKHYNDDDLDTYKKILNETKAHLNIRGRIKSNAGYKYREIIAPLFKSIEKKGEGLVYYNDPNELVDRLRLLVASKNAGHNNHNNEILSIVEELRESNLIF